MQSSTDDVIWRQIANQRELVPSPSHPNFVDVYPGIIDFTRDSIPWECSARSISMPGAGTCNSHRKLYDNRCRDYWFPDGCTDYPDSLDPCDAPGEDPFNPSFIWRATVPVIADYSTGAGACAGIAGSTHDPLFNPSSDTYAIIGFISLDLIDVDIGADPPQLPTVCTPPMPWSSYRPWGFTGGRCNNVRARLPCGATFVASSEFVGPRTVEIVQ